MLILLGFGAWSFVFGCMNLVHWLQANGFGHGKHKAKADSMIANDITESSDGMRPMYESIENNNK